MTMLFLLTSIQNNYSKTTKLWYGSVAMRMLIKMLNNKPIEQDQYVLDYKIINRESYKIVFLYKWDVALRINTTIYCVDFYFLNNILCIKILVWQPFYNLYNIKREVCNQFQEKYWIKKIYMI